MRTTLTIDDELLARAKQVAARTHQTLGSVVEAGLRKLLDEQPARAAGRFTLPDFNYSGGVRAGVDIDDRDGLAEILDQADGTNAVV